MLALEDAEDHDSPRSGTSSDGSAIAGTSLDQYDQHPALWKRTIPKGRRCEPLDFSGLILYDEHGNRLHHFTPNSSYPLDGPEEVVDAA
jgi:hypothetical protein